MRMISPLFSGMIPRSESIIAFSMMRNMLLSHGLMAMLRASGVVTAATLLIGTMLPYESTRMPSSRRTSAFPARICAKASSRYMIAISIFSSALLRIVLESAIFLLLLNILSISLCEQK